MAKQRNIEGTMGTLYEGFRDFLRTHPKGLEQWKLNNQDKNMEGPKSSEPHVDGGPFKRIPNVRNFKVTLGIKNKLLAMFGIEVKFHPTFSYEVYNNLGMNKYMNNQIYRLKKMAKENPKLYFKTVNNLLRYSRVLFIMGLHHVEPKWHRDLPLWYIYKLGKSHNRISQLKELDVRHHRLYIEKANGKKRPLGVPDLVGRIYLHQVANFLSLYLEERQFFGEEQHGFRTRLGTKTAGQKILSEVQKADGIFEFDLERCFPNIHIKGVSKALRAAKVPEGLIKRLEYLNMVPVDNPRDLRMDTKEANEGNKGMEQCRRERIESDKKIAIKLGKSNAELANQIAEQKIKEFETLRKEAIENNQKKGKMTPEELGLEQCRREEEESNRRMEENAKTKSGNPYTGFNEIPKGTEIPSSTGEATTSTLDYLQVLSSLEHQGVIKESKEGIGADIEGGEPSPEADLGLEQMFYGMDPKEADPLYKELFKGTEGDPERGLPQGLPTSPLLTIASLQHNFITKSKGKMLMYADDGLIYGGGQPPSREELITKLNSNRYGITINEEKSKFAKQPGQEIDLKFLGMRLKGDTLSAETRNGSKMVYDKHNLVDIYDMLDNGGIIYKLGSGRDIESTMACDRKPVESVEEFSSTGQFYTYQAGTRYWNRSTGEKLASSRLFGMIQSRLFQEGGNIPITQCFELTYKPNSGVDHQKDKTLNVFNSTSIASYDLLKRLSRVRNTGRGKVA